MIQLVLSISCRWSGMVLLGDDTSFEQAVIYKGYFNDHKPFMIQTNRMQPKTAY